MAEENGLPSAVGGLGRSIVPQPDPTILTTQALEREIANLQRLIETRLDGNDKSTDLRIGEIAKIPADTARLIAHLRGLMETRFNSIALQFAERDIRVETSARAGKEALDAALLAAKELVGTTNTANAIAALKSEEAVAKQIESLVAQGRATAEATDARIADLKERFDRGDDRPSIRDREYRSEQRLDIGQYIAFISVILVIIGIAASITIAVVVH